jgi:hypothetical protein
MRGFLRRAEAAADIFDKLGIPCSPKRLATRVARGGGPLPTRYATGRDTTSAIREGAAPICGAPN